MALLDIRQRTGWLFMAVVVGHILLISTQVNTRRGVPVLEELTFGVFAEVQRAATSGHRRGARRAGRTTSRCSRSAGERGSASSEVAQLESACSRSARWREQSRMLQELLDMKTGDAAQDDRGGDVIASGASPDFRTMTIDKGTSDGLQPDMAVICAGRRRRPHHPADAAGRQSAAAHRPRRGGRAR